MTSLSRNARIAGLLFCLSSVVGATRLIYIPNALFVDGNAARTASNIAAHEFLFRFGIISYLLGSALWIFVPLALYRLFQGVDQAAAVLMVILGSVMQVPIFFINSVTDVAALLIVRGADFLSAFDKPQRGALVLLFLNLHHHLDLANAIFWGLWLLPFGLLVYRSRFLPSFLGVWLIMECFAWLAFSFTGFLMPVYEDKVFKFSQPLMLAELVTMLWLTIIGVREQYPAVAKSTA